MASIPRGKGNVYEFEGIRAKEPQYGTLSYTWGRWRLEDGPDVLPGLPIRNIPWRVPAVREDHFTREAFQNVVRKIQKEGIDWAWIDVGCIDQRRSAENTQAAIEIGRQVSIFKQAKACFVWLSRLETARTVQAMGDIMEYGRRLSHYLTRPGKGIDLDDTMDRLRRSYDYFFGDPWFSSMWTLQEIILRNDALLLTAEAEPVLWHVQVVKGQRTYMTLFINHCANVYMDLEEVAGQINPSGDPSARGKVHDDIERARQLILQAGFTYLFGSNPNYLYGTARHRSASQSEDRIYAIMQIYDLCVGKSARPGEDPSLEELVTEFAGAINRRSAILGQCFIHTTEPKTGFTWRMTDQLAIPNVFRFLPSQPDLATIELDRDGNCVAAGKCCRLPTLVLAFAEDRRSRVASRTSQGYEIGLVLDSHIDGFVSFDEPSPSYEFRRRDSNTIMDCEKVRVLWLGDGTKLDKPGSGPIHLGLLLSELCRDTQNGRADTGYERLGLVQWSAGEGLPSEYLNNISWETHDRLVLR